MESQGKSNTLKNYKPFNKIEICTNKLENVKFLFTYDYVTPLLIGNGKHPLIWLSVLKPGTLSWFYIVIENESPNKNITVDLTEENVTKIIDSNNTILLNAKKISETEAKINKIDLRPIGLAVYCENDTLNLGNTRFQTSTFGDMNAMVEFRTSLKELYETILSRFPAGREASYLLGNKDPDIEVVKQNLKYISEGKDSDRRYTDEYSRTDALNFLRVLETALKVPQLKR